MACSLWYNPQALHKGSLLADRRQRGVTVAPQLWQCTPMPAAALIAALDGLRGLVSLVTLLGATCSLNVGVSAGVMVGDTDIKSTGFEYEMGL
jgi:hypothetical protein